MKKSFFRIVLVYNTFVCVPSWRACGFCDSSNSLVPQRLSAWYHKRFYIVCRQTWFPPTQPEWNPPVRVRWDLALLLCSSVGNRLHSLTAFSCKGHNCCNTQWCCYAWCKRGKNSSWKLYQCVPNPCLTFSPDAFSSGEAIFYSQYVWPKKRRYKIPLVLLSWNLWTRNFVQCCYYYCKITSLLQFLTKQDLTFSVLLEELEAPPEISCPPPLFPPSESFFMFLAFRSTRR